MNQPASTWCKLYRYSFGYSQWLSPLAIIMLVLGTTGISSLRFEKNVF